MNSKKCGLLFAALMSFFATASAAASGPNIHCIDHGLRFTLDDFVPTSSAAGTLSFVDGTGRIKSTFFCGLNNSQDSRIQIACATQRLEDGRIARARVHRQLQPGLARVAVIEILHKSDPLSNEVIPLVCYE